MWTKWKHHVWAVAILLAAGLSTTVTLPTHGPAAPRTWGIFPPEQVPGTVGTRFFGYGALVLLSLALAMGPLARLQPRRFARLIPYRRAVGIWSALAGVIHLLFVLQLVSWDFYAKTWLTLFVRPNVWFTETGGRMVRYYVALEPVSVVAWTGLLALALLLVVALVSNDRAQRFLGQASWKLVQQWSYTAFLFVTLHLLVMRYAGKLKLSPPLVRWAFWALGATALLQFAGFCYTVYKRRGRSGADTAA